MWTGSTDRHATLPPRIARWRHVILTSLLPPELAELIA